MIKLENVAKVYESEGAPVRALDGLTLEVERGEMVAIMGPSGCGKSTLLHLVGGLDVATSGSVVVGGTDLSALDESGLTRFRREVVGIVFQFYNLLPTLSVLENIALPAILAGRSQKQATGDARRLADSVGIGARAEHMPHQLSGGEMQRAAIARALVNSPAVVLADEPTGNLDSASASQVLDVLKELPEKHGVTLVVVTHSEQTADAAGRVVHMKDGRVEEA